MNSKLFPGLTHSKLRRAASLTLTGFAMIVMLAFTAQKAYAHNIVLTTGTPVCNSATGVVTVPFTATSWDPGSTISPTMDDGENNDIQVAYNGAVVGSGAFLDATGGTFSGSGAAPAGVTSFTATATALDNWGDGFPALSTPVAMVTVDISSVLPCGTVPPGNARFTGGGQQVIVDGGAGSGPVELAKGFEVECDMDPAHENLELNWLGNHFHMDTITAAACHAVPPPPNPPAVAGNVNQIIAAGTGDFNGAEGYTVLFTLEDHGEPGAGVDKSGFKVCQTASKTSCPAGATVVLNVPLNFIENGNIQAHDDQGH